MSKSLHLTHFIIRLYIKRTYHYILLVFAFNFFMISFKTIFPITNVKATKVDSAIYFLATTSQCRQG